MSITLVACGEHETKIEPTENEATENIVPDNTETPVLRKLILKEMDMPTIDVHPYFHEDVAGIVRGYSDTNFKFDIIDMYAAVQNSSFYSQVGRHLQMMTSEDSQFYHPDYPMYDFYNGVYCDVGGTEELPDISIALESTWNSTYFTNPNAITLVVTYNLEALQYNFLLLDYM